MKTIGILGGMSAESTQIYYRELCAETRRRLGGLHSPELLIRSLDFANVAALQARGDWDAAGRMLAREALALERAGAGLLLLATNTMHKLADAMMSDLRIPLLHIADATAEAIVVAGLNSPGLIATAFTMEDAFYVERLRAAGLTPRIPPADERREIHRIIYDELCQGVVRDASASAFAAIAARLVERGADSVILGCTEVGLLLNEHNVRVPLFDTVRIHCHAALDAALADDDRRTAAPDGTPERGR